MESKHEAPSQELDLKHSPNHSLEGGPSALCYLGASHIVVRQQLCSKLMPPRVFQDSCRCWNNRWLCKQGVEVGIPLTAMVNRFERTYFNALVKLYIPVPNLPAGISAATLPGLDDPRITEHSEHLESMQGAVCPASPRSQPRRVPCQRTRSLP